MQSNMGIEMLQDILVSQQLKVQFETDENKSRNWWAQDDQNTIFTLQLLSGHG